ncbi:uncharacterized protein LOC135181588 isoform X1 [Pogoniulus pusillus]|uniref:uncharacterized protein LOC135181588 isoform X1 n=1 Tax=Pogoniulus pusillus TaxID=488313 RepID=UPI0030B92871
MVVGLATTLLWVLTIYGPGVLEIFRALPALQYRQEEEDEQERERRRLREALPPARPLEPMNTQEMENTFMSSWTDVRPCYTGHREEAEVALPDKDDQADVPASTTGGQVAALEEEPPVVKMDVEEIPAPETDVKQAPVAQTGTAADYSPAMIALARSLMALAVEVAIAEELCEDLETLDRQAPAVSSPPRSRRRFGAGILRRMSKGLRRAGRCFLCAFCMARAQRD